MKVHVVFARLETFKVILTPILRTITDSTGINGEQGSFAVVSVGVPRQPDLEHIGSEVAWQNPARNPSFRHQLNDDSLNGFPGFDRYQRRRRCEPRWFDAD